MELAVITDPSYQGINAIKISKTPKQRTFPIQTTLSRKKVLSRNNKLDPLFFTQTNLNQAGQSQNYITNKNGSMISPKNLSSGNFHIGTKIDQGNNPMSDQHFSPKNGDDYMSLQGSPMNLSSPKYINSKSQKYLTLDKSKFSKKLSPLSNQQNDQCKKHNKDIASVVDFNQQKYQKQQKKQQLQDALEQLRTDLNLDRVSPSKNKQNILGYSTKQQYYSQQQQNDAFAKYPQLSLYERLHLDISGLHPLAQSRQKSQFMSQNSMSNGGGHQSSLSSALKERNQFLLKQKSAFNKMGKDLPKPILDESKIFSKNQSSRLLDLSSVDQNTKAMFGQTQISLSFKERVTKLRKIIYNLRLQLEQYFQSSKQQDDNVQNQSSLQQPIKDQIKLMRGFLQQYLNVEDLQSISKYNYQLFYDYIMGDNDKVIIQEFKNKTYAQLFLTLLNSNSLGVKANLFQMDTTQHSQNHENDITKTVGNNSTFLQQVMNKSKSNHSILSIQQYQQMSKRNNTQNQHSSSKKKFKTFKESIDQFKNEFISNYEQWQGKIEHDDISDIYRRISSQPIFSEKDHQKVLTDYINNNKKIIGTEILMPSVERQVAKQSLNSSSINFGYGGLNVKHRESPHDSKIMNAMDTTQKGSTQYKGSSSNGIKREENVGVLKRNKLLLEHVVINRNKSLSTLVQEQGIVQKKKLTSNIGNSNSKTIIDVDYLELEKYIKSRQQIADNHLKLTYHK
eukprot:403349013